MNLASMYVRTRCMKQPFVYFLNTFVGQRYRGPEQSANFRPQKGILYDAIEDGSELLG